LAAPASSLLAADFCTVETVFLQRLHVLFFIHLASGAFFGQPAPSTPAV